MANLLLLSLTVIIFSLFSVPAASSQSTLSNAIEILSDSGFLSMALTLQITSKSMNLESKPITIFAPSDLAFFESGQLSFTRLQYHISPTRISQDSLTTLCSGEELPTFLSNQSLVVTYSDPNRRFSINGVSVQGSAVFDDGYVIVYGIDEFFNNSFRTFSTKILAPDPNPNPNSVTAVNNNSSQVELTGIDSANDDFDRASAFLISRGGFTVMATFLDLQLSRSQKAENVITIFAPNDEEIEANVKNNSNNITNYVSIFRRHIVPRLLTWRDLIGLSDGTSLPSFSKGFSINVTRSADVILLNGVPVTLPDMYFSAQLAVHGVDGLLMPQANKELTIGESFSELNGGIEDFQNPFEFGEYGLP